MDVTSLESVVFWVLFGHFVMFSCSANFLICDIVCRVCFGRLVKKVVSIGCEHTFLLMIVKGCPTDNNS